MITLHEKAAHERSQVSIDWAGLGSVKGLRSLEICFVGERDAEKEKESWLFGTMCQIIQNVGRGVELCWGSDERADALPVDLKALRSLASQLEPLHGTALEETEASLVITEDD